MRSLVFAVLIVTSGCAVFIDGRLDAVLPPDPALFSPATCVAQTADVGGDLEIGSGFDAFVPANLRPLQLIDVDGTMYVYFSLRTSGLAAGDACVQFRLDVDEPDVANEVVAFDRYVISLGDDDVLGIPIPLENPALIDGRGARLVIDVADADEISVTREVRTSVE